MTAQADTGHRDDIIARNLAAVEQHFHNETPETIDQAIAVYTDDIVWEVWRDITDHVRVQDDIPDTATVQVFG